MHRNRPTVSTLLALCGALLLPPRPVAEPSLPTLPELPNEAEARAEHFLVEWRGRGPHPGRGLEVIDELDQARARGELGIVEFRRRRVDGGWQLEQDIAFPFEGIRLMAVECLSAKSPRLVWREVTERGGRTIFAEWMARSEQLKVLEWGLDGSLRESLETSRGAVMPQYLLELARSGRVDGGSFEVFDPLRGRLEHWTLEQRYVLGEPGDERTAADPSHPRREIELRRDDGTLAGRYRFEGTDLIGFEWQEGGLALRRIDAAEYEERRQAWGLDPQAEEDPDGAPPAVKDL